MFALSAELSDPELRPVTHKGDEEATDVTGDSGTTAYFPLSNSWSLAEFSFTGTLAGSRKGLSLKSSTLPPEGTFAHFGEFYLPIIT